MKFFIKFTFGLLFVLSLFLTPNNAVASTLLYTETFTSSNGTELSSYNPDWIVRFQGGANGFIQNNSLVDIGNNSGYYYSPVNNLENVCVTADFKSGWIGSSWISLVTRRNNGDHLYVASFDNKNSYSIGKDYAAYVVGQFPGGPIDNNWHKIKFCSIGHINSLYLDSSLLASFNDASYQAGFVGFDMANGMNIDNLEITSVDSSNFLDVPLLKQTDLNWGDQTYDNAQKWSPKSSTIASWGCALTSAAMVFQYNDIKKLPDGSNLDPGTLNLWLKNQKDGYIGNGLVNWLALSRLSKLAKNINNLNYDALEYKRKNGYNPSDLINDINNGIPGILQEPGHFVVAKGFDGSTFDINDPYYSRNTLDEGYNNSFSSIGTYTKSATDLSYIMIVVNKGVNMSLSGGNSQDGEFFTNEAINNTTDGNPNGEGINTYLLPKPQEGNYLLTLSSSNNQPYDLKIYKYNQNGDVFIYREKGAVGPRNEKNITVEFDNLLYPTKATYVSTILDLEKAKISDLNLKINLTQLIIKAKVQNVFGNREMELSLLDDFLTILNDNQELIPEQSYSKLLYDINYLSSEPLNSSVVAPGLEPGTFAM